MTKVKSNLKHKKQKKCNILKSKDKIEITPKIKNPWSLSLEGFLSMQFKSQNERNSIVYMSSNKITLVQSLSFSNHLHGWPHPKRNDCNTKVQEFFNIWCI